MEAIAPFEFVYGSPRVGSIRIATALDSQEPRLCMLEETRLLADRALHAEQSRRKAWHDRHLRRPQFATGDLVLLHHARKVSKARKFTPAWQGPFRISHILPNDAIQVTTLQGVPLPLVNGSRLKLYQSP